MITPVIGPAKPETEALFRLLSDKKTITFSLPFLDGAVTGYSITDGDDKHSFTCRDLELSPGDTIEIDMDPNGGFV